MTFFTSSNPTVTEIASIVGELPSKEQKRILRNLKLMKAKKIARKLDSGKKLKRIFTDDEIADMIHEYRKKKWNKGS